MLMRFYLMTALLSASLGSPGSEGHLPSVDDLVSDFGANCHAFPTLCVLWTRKHEIADARFRLWEISAEKYRSESNDASKTARERARSLQLLKWAKNGLTNPVLRRPSTIMQEFRSDRTSFQYRRFSASNESELPNGYSFSKRLPADASNLQSVFAQTRISAYDSATSTFKFWIGRAQGKAFYRAEIRRSRLADDEAYIPPLGLDSDVHGGILNEIDAFFALRKSQMNVLRAEICDGRETYVVEHRDERKLPPDFLPGELKARFPGKFQLIAITTAWIDAKRGSMPLRIEKSAAFFYEGRRLGPIPQPSESVRVIKIQRIDRGGWYPTKGLVYSFNQDPEWKGGQNDVEKLLTNRFYDIPHVIMNKTSWDIQHIETVPDTKDFFKFDFPNDTEYYDETSRKLLFIGDQEKYNDQVSGRRKMH
jgi:hypothetical protein